MNDDNTVCNHDWEKQEQKTYSGDNILGTFVICSGQDMMCRVCNGSSWLLVKEDTDWHKK